MICEYYRFSGMSLRILLVSALADPFTKWIVYQKCSLVLEASPELNQYPLKSRVANQPLYNTTW